MAGVQIFTLLFFIVGCFLYMGESMEQGKFYYITDEYYEKFYEHGIMGNKDEDEYGKHGRPCFYCFKSDDFYWMIPVSSKLSKYEELFKKKKMKYPNYDGIRFGYVNGKKRAFLLQNICPITEQYIACEYMTNNNTVPVTVSDATARELNGIARKIIRFYRKGTKIVLTDLDYIINELKKDTD